MNGRHVGNSPARRLPRTRLTIKRRQDTSQGPGEGEGHGGVSDTDRRIAASQIDLHFVKIQLRALHLWDPRLGVRRAEIRHAGPRDCVIAPSLPPSGLCTFWSHMLQTCVEPCTPAHVLGCSPSGDPQMVSAWARTCHLFPTGTLTEH